MKKKLTFLTTIVSATGVVCFISAIILTFCSGCKTTTTVSQGPDGSSVTNSVTTIDPARTSAVIKAIIPPAVRLAVTKEPKSYKWITDAQIAICALSASTNVTPALLKAVVTQATGQAPTPEVQATAESIYGIYAAYWQDVVLAKTDQNAQLAALRPVLEALCESLTIGLAGVTPPGN